MPINHLFVLLKLLPDTPENPRWDWKKLSGNPGINMGIVLDHISSNREKNNIDNNGECMFYKGKAYEWDLFNSKFMWNWDKLSGNPAIKLKDILDHPEIPWNRKFVASNPSILPRDLLTKSIEDRAKLDPLNHPTYTDEYDITRLFGWDRQDISRNPNLTIDFLLELLPIYEENDDPPIKMEKDQALSDLRIKEVMENIIKERWDWGAISANPGIKMEDIINYSDLLTKSVKDPALSKPDLPSNKTGIIFPWDWERASSNPNLKFKLILDNDDIQDKGWNWYELSKNPGITVEEILIDRDLPWDIDGLSWNKNITEEFIDKFTVREGEYIDTRVALKRFSSWDWRGISSNLNITLNDVLECHFFRPLWGWKEISRNPNFTLKDILEHPEIPWEWKSVSMNINITMHDILNNPKLPWNWRGISSNPNITAKFVLDNLDTKQGLVSPGLSPGGDWDWKRLSKNPFNRYNAAVTIQRAYRKYGAFPKWKRDIKECNSELVYSPYIKGIGFREAQENWSDRISLANRHNAAVIIQRFWRKKVHFIRWREAIKEINNEIIYSPDGNGVGFREAQEGWNNRNSIKKD